MLHMIDMNVPEHRGATQLGLAAPGGPHDHSRPGQEAVRLWDSRDLRILGSAISAFGEKNQFEDQTFGQRMWFVVRYSLVICK